MKLRLILGLCCSLGVGSSASVYADQYFEKFELFVPSTPGGGWDQTATAMQQVLLAEGLVGEIEIVRSPGVGGLIGLAQFLESRQGQGNTLLIGGMGMVGAIENNRAAISLEDSSLVARLTRDTTSIAVPANSQIPDFASLIEAFVTDPALVNWIGGSNGGSDELLLRRMASSLGLAQSKLNYRALPGGGDVAQALIRGEFIAGVSGYSELAPYAEEGSITVLAVSADKRLPGLEVPTLYELGLDVAATNWRGVFAPPGISAEQEKRLLLMIGEMVSSDGWQKALANHWWQDAFLTGPAFADFLASEQVGAKQSLGSFSSAEQTDMQLASVLGRRYWAALSAFAIAVLLSATLVVFRARSKRRELALIHDLEEYAAYAEENAAELQKVLAGITSHVNDEFDKWCLTDAEKDVGMLMLKGLRLKEIANARGTSERTVRQQAQSIYNKSGIEGRSNLAAYFLEDFFDPPSLREEGA